VSVEPPGLHPNASPMAPSEPTVTINSFTFVSRCLIALLLPTDWLDMSQPKRAGVNRLLFTLVGAGASPSSKPSRNRCPLDFRTSRVR
jgi:hypothetical protein